MRKLKNIIALISILSLFSCMEYKEVELIEVKQVVVKVFSMKEIRLAAYMQIHNPNNYKITITEADMELFVKGKKIGNARLDNTITLPKNSNEVHEALVFTPMSEMQSNAIPTILGLIGQPTVPVNVKGYVKGKVKGVAKKIPIEFTENVRLKQ
ncbi:MAG: LEA type 2 family protein [Vicingaceae bacterium]|nr:LEA type 2 family protein [Vicingaceae bacterium]